MERVTKDVRDSNAGRARPAESNLSGGRDRKRKKEAKILLLSGGEKMQLRKEAIGLFILPASFYFPPLHLD